MDSPEYKTEDGKFDKAKYRKATKQLTDPLKKAQSELTLRMKDASLPSKDIGEAFSGGTSIKGIIQDTIKSISDVFVGGVYDAFGDTRKAANLEATGDAPILRPKLRPTTLSQLNPTQKVAQQAAAKERLTAKQQREEAGRIAAAQRAADAARLDSDRASGNRTSYTTSGGSTYVMNPDGTRGYTGGTNWSTGQAAADRQAAEVADREKGYEQQRESFFFGNQGGLVSMPAKKQKKRTTQRRKGLGTRP